jgi:hypothetical protein
VIEFNANWVEGHEDCSDDEDNSDESDDGDGDWQDVDNDIDCELVESMEAVAFADEYRIRDEEHFLYLDSSDVEYASGSPKKRGRDI